MATSLLLGIAGDLILSNQAWGISLPLYTGFLIAQVLLLLRMSERKISRTAIGLLFAALAFSLCFMWRDAPELKLINGFAVFALVGLAAIHATGKRLETATILDFGVKALALWAVFIADFFTLFIQDVKWAEAIKRKGLEGTSAIGRGLLIAIPLLLVFGGLLISADAAFQRFLQQFVDFDAGAAVNHVLVGLACATLTGGLLRHLFLSQEKPPMIAPLTATGTETADRTPPAPEPFRLGATELGIVLGSLNVLFAAFVLVEVPYLFGGARHVLATEHLSYAEYARRGFFELVSVVALAIPVLLGSHALLRKETSGAQKVWKAMSVVMVSLLFIVMNSAVERMRLYVDLYSLTTLRIYVMASLGWMAMMMLWFLATTVRGRNERFAFGAFASLLGTILIANVINPDALIVRYNVAQARPGKAIDGAYLLGLSADATPELIRNEGKLTVETRAALASNWLRTEKESRGSWRSWTISSQAANDAIVAARTVLTSDASKLVASTSPSGEFDRQAER